MSSFRWNEKTNQAPVLLAEGRTHQATANECGVNEKTIRRWLADTEFSAEVDRLSQMIDVANRAHRVRMANRVIQKMRRKDGSFESKRDVLDWLKYVKSETDGIKLDLADLAEKQASNATN